MAVQVKILQGAREIGGTCIEIRSGESCILLDIGLSLQEDIPPLKLPDKVDAVLVSHYHKDHWGLMDLLNDETEIYLPGKTKELLLLQQKLVTGKSDSKLEGAVTYKPGETLQIGEFRIKTHLVDHSAMDACAFEIEVEGERIVYTGDFRSHGRKGKLWPLFIKYVGQPVDRLICEGTMLSRKGRAIPTEDDLETRAVKTMSDHQGGLALGWCSTVNFDRITTFYRAAKRSGRKLAVDIFTAALLHAAARDNRLPDPKTFDDILVYYPPKISGMIERATGPAPLYPYARKKLAREEADLNPGRYLILVRPSSEKSWLETISHWENSVLFYSQWSGYRELPGNREFLKKLKERGCRDVTLHTSGHADAKTLQKTIEALQPKEVIPVHTENPEWFASKHQRE